MVDGKMGELVRAARMTRELERVCHDPREPIARKVRRMQRVRSPELPPRVRALRSNDPSWPELFRSEEQKIRAALGDAVARIEHFGSTAIPDPSLSAKNVVDFLVALRDPSVAPEAEAVLGALGYVSYGDGPCDPETVWWWRIDDEAAFVAHLCDAGNPWIDTVVNYRDYMRAHPEECARYEAVKRGLAAEPDRSLFEYSLGKLRLFYEISGKADAWKARQAS
ncbi:MAG TPA: GrpB family protein [Thermoanaerobaculia bacterium]|nr:GrpB family protein [Thermoanaerobaculia bacterium]